MINFLRLVGIIEQEIEINCIHISYTLINMDSSNHINEL